MMTMSTKMNPIAQLQQQREMHMEERHLAMTQTTHSLNSIDALATVRPIPNQEEDPMFPTPESSPRYTMNTDGNNGYAPFYASPHHSPIQMQGIDMDAQSMQSVSPNGSYMGGPSSPGSDYYPSPYASPYDTSSPHSIHDGIDCSPHSTTCSTAVMNLPVCTGSSLFTTSTGAPYMSPAPLPPVTSVLASEAFPTDSLENKPLMSCSVPLQLHGSQEIYPPMSAHSQHNHIFDGPNYGDSFCQPPSVMPPTSSSLCRVSSGSSIPGSEGELPIKIVEQQPFHSDHIDHIHGGDIAYYPPTPESPESRRNRSGYCLPNDSLPMSKQMMTYPPFMGQSFYPPTKQTKKPRRPKKPAVEVDDSEIKDIPTSAQLWEFTLRVLKKPKYHYMVNWENQQEGLFRFHDAQAFSALWGKHRNRPHMTYDKVARALRYYYKRDILNQVGGRLTYKFSKRLSKLYTNEE